MRWENLSSFEIRYRKERYTCLLYKQDCLKKVLTTSSKCSLAALFIAYIEFT